jgi:hypothetical protein
VELDLDIPGNPDVIDPAVLAAMRQTEPHIRALAGTLSDEAFGGQPVEVAPRYVHNALYGLDSIPPEGAGAPGRESLGTAAASPRIQLPVAPAELPSTSTVEAAPGRGTPATPGGETIPERGTRRPRETLCTEAIRPPTRSGDRLTAAGRPASSGRGVGDHLERYAEPAAARIGVDPVVTAGTQTVDLPHVGVAHAIARA